MALGAALSPYDHAQAQGAAEYDVKAAFLYKFASFTEWPAPAATGAICIGVAGEDPFGPVLDDIVRDKTMNGRPFLIKRFRSGLEIANCHIVFISSSESRRLKPIFDRLQGQPVLTVGDVSNFCASGGAIGFEIVADRVRLQINVSALERAHLQMSSKLLSLAKLVRDSDRAADPAR